MVKKFLKLFAALFIFSLILFCVNRSSVDKLEKEVIICLDPGHGGKPEYGNSTGGDRWSADKKTYLNYYNYGGGYKDIIEHEYVYDVAIDIKKHLESFNTFEGLSKLKSFLNKNGIEIIKDKKIIFKPFLSRKDSYTRNKDLKDDVNSDYRIFDYPKSPEEKDYSLKSGRLSFINSKKPQITLSLHLNYVESQKYQGMLSFFSPSYNVFKQIYENKEDSEYLDNHPIKEYWNILSKRHTMKEYMINDSQTYFKGKKLSGREIGKRYNMISWKYKDEEFWKREKSIYEKYRRDSGPEGLGGDNLYLGSEILRWISFFSNKELGKTVEILSPRASDWSVSLYTNSITSGLELGNIFSDHDRSFLKNNKDKIAYFISCGLYCVLNDINIKKSDNTVNPLGIKLNLKKYKKYFDEVICENR